MTRLELTGDASNSVSSTALIGMQILEVSVDGFGRSKIILSGSPVNQEVLFTNSSGSLTFAQTLGLGTQIFILYQNA